MANQAQAASFEDLTAWLAGADSDFIRSQLNKKATIVQAQDAWIAEKKRRIKAGATKQPSEKVEARRDHLDAAKQTG